MTLARLLMITSEVLVAVALLGRFLLPTNFDITFRISANAGIGIPIRWFLPLLLISGAGLFSTTALLKMYWTLAHHP